jgi:hypothetical protein
LLVVVNVVRITTPQRKPELSMKRQIPPTKACRIVANGIPSDAAFRQGRLHVGKPR